MVVRLADDAFQNDLVPKIDHFGGPDFGSIFAHENRGRFAIPHISINCPT